MIANTPPPLGEKRQTNSVERGVMVEEVLRGLGCVCDSKYTGEPMIIAE